MIPAPGGSIALADGRRLAYDDVGDPDGVPVVYLHGFGDSRLTRHPDDGLARAAGVRLLAVDRPGYGESDACPGATHATVARDVGALLDAARIERAAVVGWSAGGPVALACGALDERVEAVAVVAGVPPIEADDDPAVVAALDPLLGARREALANATAEGLGWIVAELGAPLAPSLDLAREHVLDGADGTYRRDLESVPGLLDQLALGAAAATVHGLAGAATDARLHLTPWSFELAAVRVPVVLWYGTHDARSRPPVGQWLADRLPDGRLETVDGASHLVLMTHWSAIVSSVVDLLDRKDSHASQP